jgi:hypothetical protein
MLCAVSGGAQKRQDIEDVGEAHLDWFQKRKLFPDEVPIHDTIILVMSESPRCNFSIASSTG